jgi:predicted transcriptional regulator
VTLRLKQETISELDEFATRLDRSRDELASEALEGWLAHQRYLVRKIEEGIAAAERGEFASEQEVSRALAKYGVAW